MSIKEVAKRLAGRRAVAKFRSYRDRIKAYSTTTLRIGNFDLRFPGDHILPLIYAKQPLRHLALGILAGELNKKYPGEVFVDVGANVGDTAAIVATYSDAPMYLIEPSIIFFDFLVENAATFPNKTEPYRAFVLSEDALNSGGYLAHCSGTARFDRSVKEKYRTSHNTLSQVAGDHCRLIKIDTDGFDFPIILSSLDFLSERTPCLYYENEVRDHKSLDAADRVVEGLSDIGYEHFAIFDSTGLHIATTSDISVVKSLNRYLLNAHEHLYNYDIVCLPGADRDVAASLTSYFDTVASNR